VLCLAALEEPTEEVQARDRGLLAHRVLRNFFRRRQVGTDRAAPLTHEDLPEATDEIVDELKRALRDEDHQLLVGHRRLWELEGERLRADLLQLLDHEATRNAPPDEGKKEQDYCPPRVVWGTEIAYGRGSELVVGEGEERVLITGRIDRIDIIPDTDPVPFIVLDYKLGDGPPKSAIEDGCDFQLPLYCMAAQMIEFAGSEAEPLMWAYYRVRRPVDWKGRANAGEIPELLRRATELILQHVAAIRAGQFPVEPSGPQCRYCDFRPICRYSRARTEKKTARPAREKGDDQRR
jgi:ATP-dependent helicase/DNAse subunit B